MGAPLPEAMDRYVPIPPVRFAWVRQVTGQALWIFYRFDDAELVLLTMSSRQP
jgi:hypothetical protein